MRLFRSRFGIEHRRAIQLKVKPKWPYYQHLLFLADHIKYRTDLMDPSSPKTPAPRKVLPKMQHERVRVTPQVKIKRQKMSPPPVMQHIQLPIPTFDHFQQVNYSEAAGPSNLTTPSIEENLSNSESFAIKTRTSSDASLQQNNTSLNMYNAFGNFVAASLHDLQHEQANDLMQRITKEIFAPKM